LGRLFAVKFRSVSKRFTIITIKKKSYSAIGDWWYTMVLKEKQEIGLTPKIQQYSHSTSNLYLFIFVWT